jgi:hypothetical protein
VCVILVKVVADQEQHDGVERSRIIRRYPKIRRDGAVAVFAHWNVLGRRLWNAPAAGADSEWRDANDRTTVLRKLSVYMEKDDVLARMLFCDEAVFHCIRKVNKQNGRILCIEPPREVVDYKCDCPMVS